MSYDSRSPAPGVRVAPMTVCGQDRVTGLSMGQAKAARNTNWLTPHHKKGGCFKQAGACFARTVKPTRSPFHNRTPGRKGPSQAIKRKTNVICRNKIQSLAVREEVAAQRMDRVVENAFKKISQQHAGMLGAGLSGDEKLYEERRMMFLEKYPMMKSRLDEREAIHRKTIVVGCKSVRPPVDQSISNQRSVAGNVMPKVRAIVDARKAAVRVVHSYPAQPSKSFWNG
jgi:hypothetical protein